MEADSGRVKGLWGSIQDREQAKEVRFSAIIRWFQTYLLRSSASAFLIWSQTNKIQRTRRWWSAKG